MSSRIASTPPLAVPPFHPALYTVNRKWSHNGKLTIPDLVPSASSRNDEQETDIDGEEWDKVREMLGRILAPQVVRVGPTEADIAWQQLDTSEAAAPGGPFPQIDASEFTYQIVLFENHGRFVSTYRCVSRGIDHLVVAWRPPNDNGASISNYTVYISKPSEDVGEKVWEGRLCEARITNLRPATSYRLRVTAANRIGESSEAAPIVVTTRSDCPPPAPPPPNVVSVNARCVKLAWSNNPECTYTVEMHDVAAGPNAITVVKDRVGGASAQIMDLKAGSEYRFRVIAHNAEGESPRSDWTYVRMTGRGTPDRVLEPTKPLAVARGRNKFDVSWKCPGAKEREFTYVLEGSTANQPNRFRVLYRGPLSTHTVTDEDIVHLRVQSINRKNVAVRAVVIAQDGSRYEGDWSPVTGGNAPRDAPSTPTELAINSERTTLTWKAPESSPDIRYRVHCSQVMSGHETEETVSETGECHYSLALLDHAKQFTCRMVREISISPPASSGSCEYRIADLQADTDYRVELSAENAVGCGIAAAITGRTRPPPPDPPKHTGTGPWSSVYAFRTALSPPPAVKGPPTATPSGDGYYQLEWSSVITKPNTKKCFYRLQAVDCSIDNAKWMTVYEGTLPSHTLRLSDYPSAVQARVMCVRPEGDSEISSPPSPIVYMANLPLDNDVQPIQEKKVDAIPVVRWWTMQCSLTTIMVVLFIVVSFTMALFFDSMFNLYVPPNAVHGVREDNADSLESSRAT
ncbi:fibronectin type III domain protein [Ostertagia ostertagi]